MPNTIINSVDTPTPQTMAEQPLRICIIEPTNIYAKKIIQDIHNVGIETEVITFATTYRRAIPLLTTTKPNVVFLSLDMPNDGAFRLMKDFPVEKRDFLIILLSTPFIDKWLIAGFMSNFVCSGYLVKGLFGHTTLLKTLENIRHDVRLNLLHRYREVVWNAVTSEFSDAEIFSSEDEVHDSSHSGEQLLHNKTPNGASSNPASFQIQRSDDGKKYVEQVTWEQVICCKAAANYKEVQFFALGKTPQEVGQDKALRHVCKGLVRSEELDIPNDFIKPHRSYWVQKIFIEDVEDNALVLVTGEKIPLSVRNREIITAILERFSVQFATANRLVATLRAKM